jgi:hypothetical protein
MEQDSPLTEHHLTKLNDALAQLSVADRHLQLAKLAGLDVTQQEKQAAETRDRLLRIKQVYFPGR